MKTQNLQNSTQNKTQKGAQTYAFIDASNIIYGARAQGWFIDQKKLFQYLKKKFNISKAFFYYGKDSKNEKQEKFLKKLKVFGYTLRVKEVKRFGKRAKANCDVDLTMDMLIMINDYKRAVVLTGDGDFTPLFSYLISKKKKKIVVISSPKRTAKEIRTLLGGNVLSFDDLRYLLEYREKTQKKREALK